MTHRTYAAAVVAAVAAWSSFLAGTSYFLLPPLVGDLTRIGRLSEADYGYTVPQQGFAKPLFDLEPATFDHDVVVLGDSFSLNQVSGWQNYVAATTGARIATFSNYYKTWEAILADPAYREPKVFILQSVERTFLARVARSGACVSRSSDPIVTIDRTAATPDTYLFSRPARRWFTPLGLSFAYDYIVAAAFRREGISTGDVVVAELQRPLFSSRSSHESLFLGEDREKGRWTDHDLETISCGLRQAQDNVERGGHTLFLALLLPDKLSAYGPDLVDRSLAIPPVIDRLDLRGINTVDAASPLNAAVRAGRVDVYLPDDTHLGSEGYAIVGRAVTEELRRRKVLPQP